MENLLNKSTKYIPHFLLASFIALLSYLGLTKDESSSYIKFNLDENSYVHADDPSTTNYDGGCGSSGDGDGGGDA